jgi:dipeptidyl aminopeptidase/acylaminoacyl peptidase
MGRKNRGVAVMLCAGLFLLFTFNIAAAEAEMKTKTISSYLEDIFRIKRVACVEAAGDNSKIACITYSLQTDEHKKHWQSRLYVKTVKGKEMVLAESPDDISSLHWSFDGRFLACLTRNKNEQQTYIWIYDIEHNSSYRLFTARQEIISFKWSPDGQKIAFIAADMDHRPDQNPSPLIDMNKKAVNMRLYLIAVRRQDHPEITALTPPDYSVNCGSLIADFDSSWGKRLSRAPVAGTGAVPGPEAAA